jgi:hypothetical protein
MITPSTAVRYRKVGKGVVQSHECPDGYWCELPPEQGRSHRYAVRFTTGRYRGTTRKIWLADSDITQGQETRP